MSRGTPGDNYNLKTAAIAAHDASYVLYRTGILSSGYATDASNVVNFYNLTLNNKLHVKGDFHVDGSMTEIYSSRLDISDGLIELATSNASDSIDIGFYGQYNDGSDKYTGLFRDRTGGSYKLFNNCSSRPNQAGVTGSYQYADLALSDISLSTINGTPSSIGALAINKSGVMTTVKGTLNVDEAVTLDTTLDVTGDTSVSTLDSTGATSLATGGGVVNIASSGVMTTVKGTLNVDEAVTLDTTLDVTGDTSVSTLDSTGATSLATGGGVVNIASSGVMTTVKGTLNVDEAVTLDTTLDVTGDTSVSTLDSTGATSLATGGGVVNIASSGVMTTVKGTLNVDEAVTLDTTLDVTGDTSVSTLDSTGATSLATGGGVVNIASSGVMTTVKGTLNVDEAVTLDTTLDVTGDTSVSTLDSTGATSLATGGGVVNIASSGVMTTVKGTLNVDEAVTLDSTLAVSGTITATDDITAFFDSSDRRLKKNVETIDSALSIINNLRGVRFDWNEEAQKLNENVDLNKRELGVIAQEIEKELPEVIKEGLGGYMAVRYEKITPLLIQCIKEQQTMIKQQDERISKLENSQN